MPINAKKFWSGLIIVVSLILVAYVVLSYSQFENIPPLSLGPTSTPTEVISTSTLPNNQPIKIAGTEVLKLNEEVTVNGLSIKPWAVTEDSRCPSDVQCIWAGQVKVAFSLKSSTETRAAVELKPGESTSTKSFKVTLVKVDPYPTSGHKIADAEYRITFKIESIRNVNPPPKKPISSGGCFIGGCSGQICSENPNAISTCEYSPRYACYSQGRCERQADGTCGWTMTPALKTCLANNGAATE